MHNPFPSNTDSLEDESAASDLFGGLAEEELSARAAHSIRASMMAAVVARGATMATPRRFALTGTALVAPLLVVGAAAAASGTAPLEAPGAVLEVASSAVGIGGNSGDARQDFEVRNLAASDNGQPGSQPGETENAPGLSGTIVNHAPDVAATPDAAVTPDSSEPAEDSPEVAPEDQLPPHENGKGCDDVLFTDREPPFASPGGPVGCEVGNSAGHRQNGANQDDSGAEEPTPSTSDSAIPDAEDSPGGVSHGLGKGHDEDPPGNGNGYGHDKHEHEPNPNGKGPGGPTAEATPAPETTSSPDANSAPSEPTSGDSAAPGKSGSAPGKSQRK
ncbi:MAG: hypothetical protein AB7J35_02500 [Dehalococcoidia bacterium]